MIYISSKEISFGVRLETTQDLLDNYDKYKDIETIVFIDSIEAIETIQQNIFLLNRKNDKKVYYITNDLNQDLVDVFKLFDYTIINDTYILSDESIFYKSLSTWDSFKEETDNVEELKKYINKLKKEGENNIVSSIQYKKVSKDIKKLKDLKRQLELYISLLTYNLNLALETESEELQRTKQKVEYLESDIESLNQKLRMMDEQRSESIMYFPDYLYTIRKPLLLIREVSPTPYLTSMLLIYQQYLRNKGYKIKILVFDGTINDKTTRARYKNFYEVTDKQDILNARDEMLIHVLKPSLTILDELFMKDEKGFIVLDRTTRTKESLIKKTEHSYIETLYACNTPRTREYYKIDKEQSIVALEGRGDFIVLPHVANLPYDNLNGKVQILKDTYTNELDGVKIFQELDKLFFNYLSK